MSPTAAIPTPQTPSGRIPPQNLEAEQGVLGGILLDPEAIHTVMPLLRPESFYSQAHQIIYSAMLMLFEKSQPIDLLTLTESLQKEGKLDVVGGAATLSTLVDNVHTAANIANYASIIREKATLRELITKSSAIAEEAYSAGDQVDDFLDRVEKVIFEIGEKRALTSLTPLSDVVREGFQKIEQLSDKGHTLSGLATGYAELDNLLSGLQAGDLIIVAARPSMGKTALALNIAQNVAIREKTAVAIFSLEMNRTQLAMRMLCSEGRVDSTKLRRGGLTEEDWIRLTRAAGELSDAAIFIDDSAQISALEMRAKARRLKANKGLGLIIVDYLQLMRSSFRGDNREREISEISRSLKAMAKELDIPVVALSQLNRAVESRQDKRPMMVDLRESGAIEQDADVITFIYRDEVYNPESLEGSKAEIIVGKHRNGPTGVVALSFLKQYTRFESHEYGHEHAP